MLFLLLLHILGLWYSPVLNIYELTSWSKDKDSGFSCKILCKKILILAMHFHQDFREFGVFMFMLCFTWEEVGFCWTIIAKNIFSFQRPFKRFPVYRKVAVVGEYQPTFCPHSFKNQLQTDFPPKYLSIFSPKDKDILLYNHNAIITGQIQISPNVEIVS